LAIICQRESFGLAHPCLFARVRYASHCSEGNSHYNFARRLKNHPNSNAKGGPARPLHITVDYGPGLGAIRSHSNVSGSKGLATATGPGTSQIGASLNSIATSTTMTVSP